MEENKKVKTNKLKDVTDKKKVKFQAKDSSKTENPPDTEEKIVIRTRKSV